MKKLFFLTIALSLLVSACGSAAKPAASPTGASVNPSPAAAVDLNATAAVMVQQTFQALPTQTALPSATPLVFTGTPANTATPSASPTVAATGSATPNPFLLTLTATLGTGTPATVIPFGNATGVDSGPTGTEYPRTYGTMPPSVASGKMYLINKSGRDATVSLHCTRTDGSTTIIEYPVQGTIRVIGPAGRYHYISWVGGKKFTGDFRLEIGRTVSLIFYKDRIEIKVSKD